MIKGSENQSFGLLNSYDRKISKEILLLIALASFFTLVLSGYCYYSDLKDIKKGLCSITDCSYNDITYYSKECINADSCLTIFQYKLLKTKITITIDNNYYSRDTIFLRDDDKFSDVCLSENYECYYRGKDIDSSLSFYNLGGSINYMIIISFSIIFGLASFVIYLLQL